MTTNSINVSKYLEYNIGGTQTSIQKGVILVSLKMYYNNIEALYPPILPTFVLIQYQPSLDRPTLDS